MEKYKPEVEEKLKLFYDNLSEKDRRHYSAIESLKLDHGGIKYISDLFKCSRQTITKGLSELGCGLLLDQGKIRHIGGGRKTHAVKNPNIDGFFLKCN
jgi:hypothetical protein